MTWNEVDLDVRIDAQLSWPSQAENDQQKILRRQAGHKVRAMGKDLELPVKIIVQEMCIQAGVRRDVGCIGGSDSIGVPDVDELLNVLRHCKREDVYHSWQRFNNTTEEQVRRVLDGC